jgi:hypothetical protein
LAAQVVRTQNPEFRIQNPGPTSQHEDTGDRTYGSLRPIIGNGLRNRVEVGIADPESGAEPSGEIEVVGHDHQDGRLGRVQREQE